VWILPLLSLAIGISGVVCSLWDVRIYCLRL
jgi:hypothetical protein